MNDTMVGSLLPSIVIGLGIAPYLDRITFNNLSLANKEIAGILRKILPPWPNANFTIHSKVQCIKFTFDGSILICRDREGKISYWNVRTGKKESFDDIKCCRLSNFAVSNCATYLAYGIEEGSICLRILREVYRVNILRRHEGMVYAVCFSPDSKYLASGATDGMVRLWNVEEGCCFRTLANHTGYIYSLSFSPNGNMLASSGTDKVIRLWDLAEYSTDQLIGHLLLVTSVAFSPDGQYIASGSLDNSVRLWKATGYDKFVECIIFECEVLSVSFSLESKFMAIGLSNNKISICRTSPSISVLITLMGRIGAFTKTDYTFAFGGSDNKLYVRILHELYEKDDEINYVNTSKVILNS
jgi:WD40 repeat protein